MSPEALIGMELGNSVIQRLLGQGTMGAVYLATQAGQQVAIKVFLSASPLAEDDNEIFLQRLEETIERGASLSHPHILNILNHGRHKQLVYQIMPYVAGESLETFFTHTRILSFVQIQHYLEQLAAALDYSHTRGILHGDIKASNILLTPTGDLLLNDFGLANLTIEKNFAITRRAVPGMLNTIAPEYVMSQKVDQRADLYALGAVLYQMVTGVPPFQGNSLGEVAMKHIKSAPPSPCSLRKDLPQAAEQVMLRALAKRPADRYTHVRDMASAFRLALAAAQPAPAENKATHALNILADLNDSFVSTPEQTAAPRTGGLFDPKWRMQKSISTQTTNAQSFLNAELIKPEDRPPLEDSTIPQLAPPNLSADEQPTNPFQIPQGQVSFEGMIEQEKPITQALAQENFSQQIEFSPAADATGNFKRTGLLNLGGFQANPQEQQSHTSQSGTASTIQLTESAAGNTEELRKFASQQASSPTGMLSALAQMPGSGSGTGTIKLTESVKIVQVPIAGQPGRFMTGYLPAQPPEPTTQAPRRLSIKMKIVSLILAVVIVATGSGIFLVTRSHTNQANATPKIAATPNVQASAIAQATATANANIILSDSLSQNINQWPVGQQKGFSCKFANNAYQITNNDKQNSASVLVPGKTVNGPFTYSLTMEQVKGDLTAPNNLFGMLLYTTVQNTPGKRQVDKFYAFEILNNSGGQYQFWKYDSGKSASSPWSRLWSKNFGKEFKQGSGSSHVNKIKIVATGKMFTFIVNGKQVGTWKDHSFSSGSVGMLVNLDGAEIAFSNLLLTYA